MHPILAARERAGLYLAGWLPLAPLVALLFVWGGGLPWTQAAALALPLVLLYAQLCLAAWYACRALPLRRTRLWRLIAAHLLGAALSSALWVVLGWAWAAVLASLPGFGGLAGRFAPLALPLFAVGVPLYLVAVAVHYLILAFEDSREAEARALAAQVEAREAELRALRAQLDPHFLFNSLNAVAALAGSDPAGARKMAILLAEFLRGSLRLSARASVPLGEELAHAAAYLAVERVRFGERLAVEERIEEDALGCLVPALILQPLVENAVRHGVAQLLDGGVIRLEARREGGRLHLAVENPCDPDQPASRRGSGERVGLANVAARLATRYGEAGRAEARQEAGRFRVELALPAEGAAGG
ncbi:MAG TPA: histidine kinase [Thermoanaerobaculia bacterium]|nr:histidine kinase [Thermoanaerobaculia bacterium]